MKPYILTTLYLICAIWVSATTGILAGILVVELSEDSAILTGIVVGPVIGGIAALKLRKNKGASLFFLAIGYLALVSSLWYLRVLMEQQQRMTGFSSLATAVWIGVWFWYSVPASLCTAIMGHLGLYLSRHSNLTAPMNLSAEKIGPHRKQLKSESI